MHVVTCQLAPGEGCLHGTTLLWSSCSSVHSGHCCIRLSSLPLPLWDSAAERESDCSHLPINRYTQMILAQDIRIHRPDNRVGMTPGNAEITAIAHEDTQTGMQQIRLCSSTRSWKLHHKGENHGFKKSTCWAWTTYRSATLQGCFLGTTEKRQNCNWSMPS